MLCHSAAGEQHLALVLRHLFKLHPQLFFQLLQSVNQRVPVDIELPGCLRDILPAQQVGLQARDEDPVIFFTASCQVDHLRSAEDERGLSAPQ